MAYFLKKVNRKKGSYLTIAFTQRDAETKKVVQNHIKTLGYIDDLIKDGIADPIKHYQKVVDDLNVKHRKKVALQKAEKKIATYTGNVDFNYGFYIAKEIVDKLGYDTDLNFVLQHYKKGKYEISDIFNKLIYARIINPCSKLKTYEQVIPKLIGENETNFNLNNVYDALNVLGAHYKQVIEILNHHIERKYKRKIDKTYFDGTNFYFEIDREDDIRKKGPSKENRNEPILSMGLLLDSNFIPLGMHLFPGNESEKPVFSKVINELREQNGIKGRTIRIADKGLNSGQNIIDTLLSKDGYIMSQSVKMLPQTEIEWLLNSNYYVYHKKNGEVDFAYKYCIDDFEYRYVDNYGNNKKIKIPQLRIATLNVALRKKKLEEIKKLIIKARKLNYSRAKKTEYGASAAYVNFNAVDKDGNINDDRIVATLNEEKIKKDIALAGYNLLVTSELKANPLEIYEAYHNLWHIEESFKTLKSELDARPVYLQDKNKIFGHFLVCYSAVTILRILQYKELKEKHSVSQLCNFIASFNCTKIKNQFVNATNFDEKTLEFCKNFDSVLNRIYFKKSDFKNLFKL